jgi:hypothetical protein
MHYVSFGRSQFFLRFFFLFIVLNVCISQSLYAADGWKLIKNTDGIEINSRPHKGSGINEYKGITTISDVSFDVLYAMISYTPTHNKLMHTCYEASIIKPWEKGRQINYFKFKSPWPLWDRDLIYDSRGRIDPKSGNMIVVCKAVKEPLVSLRDEFIRIIDSEHMWILEKLGSGKIRASYYNYTDPHCGSVPDMIVNSNIKDVTYYSLLNIRNLAKDPLYKKLAPKYHIDEGMITLDHFFLNTLFP